MIKRLFQENKVLFLVLLAFLVIGSIIVANIMSFSNMDSILVGKERQSQMTSTLHASEQIESHILQAKSELVTLSKFPQMSTLDVTECSGDMRIIHESIESKINSLLRADADGDITQCSSPMFTDYIGLNILNKDYFRVPMETKEAYISEVVQQGENQHIIISAPLFQTTSYTPYPNFEGRFTGELLSIIEVSSLYNLYIHPLLKGDKSYFALIDKDSGEVLLQSDTGLNFTSGPFTEKDNLNTITNIDGFGNTIITSSDISFGDESWRLFILTPTKNLGNLAESVQYRHLASLIFIILIVIVIFYLLISAYRKNDEVQKKLDKTNVTLEKLGINIETEQDRFNQADISLQPGKVYLISEQDENHAHELFISSLNAGYAGLGFVRLDPEKVSQKYNLRKTSLIWLSGSKKENVISEKDITNILALIKEFVKKSQKSVVLIDRLDYLLTENSFDSVLKGIHSLADLASENECIFILSIDSGAVAERELNAIKAETIDLYGKHLKSRISLSDMEMGILNLINDCNTQNKLVSYKDITTRFNITKPTTRTKISRLNTLGLISIEQAGRHKSLKITSAGRKFI